jgi:hypothetical protein
VLLHICGPWPGQARGPDAAEKCEPTAGGVGGGAALAAAGQAAQDLEDALIGESVE